MPGSPSWFRAFAIAASVAFSHAAVLSNAVPVQLFRKFGEGAMLAAGSFPVPDPDPPPALVAGTTGADVAGDPAARLVGRFPGARVVASATVSVTRSKRPIRARQARGLRDAGAATHWFPRESLVTFCVSERSGRILRLLTHSERNQELFADVQARAGFGRSAPERAGGGTPTLCSSGFSSMHPRVLE